MTPPVGRLASSPGSRRPPRLRWALLPVLLIVMVIGVVVALTGSSGAKTASRPAGGAASAAPVEAAVTNGAKWITGRSGKLLAVVNADLGRLAAADRAGQRSAARTAGTQLAADAKAALDGPMPPVEATVYQSALKDFEQAGAYTASGEFGPAAPLLNAGGSGITKVTAAVDTPAAVNPPAPGSDPNE
jgi:hypothetical protein